MQRSDCDGMQFNPFDLKRNELIWDKYPQLTKRRILCQWELPEAKYRPDPRWYDGFKEFHASEVIKYVILFIDTDSPLYEERDFDVRKAIALELLEFTQLSKAKREIEAQTEYLSRVIYNFFILVNNTPYEKWVSLKMNFHQMTRFLRKPLDESSPVTALRVKNETAREIDVFEKGLLNAEYLLFKDDRLKRMISDQAIDQSIVGYPEKYAKTLNTKTGIS